MILSDILSNVRRIVEDQSSFRWTDKVITEYIVEGVNEIFRKTGSVTDTSPYDLIQGESEYVINETGRITAVRLRPENNVNTITLPQVQVEELPIDFSSEGDPVRYALSQVAILGQSEILGTVGSDPAVLVNQGVTYTAVASGSDGELVTIALVDPNASSSPLTIQVTDNDIRVSLATDSSGAITTTATALVAALGADSAVTALVTPTGSGATPLVELTETGLGGGAEPVISTESAGSLTGTQKILFNRAPARSTSGALDGVYGFYVDISREFILALASDTASGGENATTIPVLPKFDRHLTNMVAGMLFMEVNDTSLMQRGQFMLETARKYIGDLAYTNSISFYVNNPTRNFP